MRRQMIYGCLVATLIVMLAGCGIVPNEAASLVLPEPPEISEDMESPPDSVIEDNEPIIKGTATRIDRAYEEYDYSGWGITTWFPGIYSMIPEGLEEAYQYDDSGIMQGDPDTMKDAAGSAVIWTNLAYDLRTPIDAVMSIVAEIQNEGYDVEYGEFRIKQSEHIRNFVWPAGYYYKRVPVGSVGESENDKWDIQVFFTLGIEEEHSLCSFSLKLSDSGNIVDSLITYEVFFQIANSLYNAGVDADEYFSEFTGIPQSFK